MSLFGRKHLIQCSTTNQDTTSMKTVDVRFRVRSGHNTGYGTQEFYRTSDETGNESHLEQAAATPVAISYAKSLELAGDSESIPFFSYWATHGGAASTDTAIASSSPAALEHTWTGPTTAYIARSFSMEDIGDSGGSDNDFNRDVHNCVPERVVVSGRRSNTTDAVIGCAVDVRGGGATAGTGSPTSVTFKRSKLFHFGMVRVVTSTNTAFDTTPAASFFNGATTPTSDANVVTLSMIQSGTAMTAAIMEFQVIMTQAFDLARSMAPGNLDANYAAYVPTSTDWVFANEAQQCEIEFLFRQDDTSGVVEGLGAEYTAGTRRSWELWIVHPGADTAPTPDLYFGIKYSFAGCTPVSWAEENDGLGERYVRARYRANWDTTADYGWHIACATQLTELGT